MSDVTQKMQIDVTETGVRQVQAQFNKLNASMAKSKPITESHKKAIDKINQSFNNQIFMMRNAKKVMDDVKAAQERATLAAKQHDAILSSQKQTVQNLARVFFGMALGYTTWIIAARTAINLFASSYKAFEDAEKKIRLTNNMLKESGNISLATSESLRMMSKELKKISEYDDEDILKNVLGTLLSFKNVPIDKLKDISKAVLNLASFRDIDIKSAAEIYGRALEDPLKATRQLRTANIILTASQVEMIKKLSETGQEAKAQAYLFDILKDKYKNSASEAITSIAKNKKAWQDFKEDFGQTTAPAITAGIKLLTKAMEGFTLISKSIKNPNPYSDTGINQAHGEWLRFTKLLKTAKNDKLYEYYTAQTILLEDRMRQLGYTVGQYNELVNNNKGKTKGKLSADDLAALEEQRKIALDKQKTDIQKYYDSVKFLDASYIKWKSAQLKIEIDNMAINKGQKAELLKQSLADLKEQNRQFQDSFNTITISDWQDNFIGPITEATNKMLELKRWSKLLEGVYAPIITPEIKLKGLKEQAETLTDWQDIYKNTLAQIDIQEQIYADKHIVTANWVTAEKKKALDRAVSDWQQSNEYTTDLINASIGSLSNSFSALIPQIKSSSNAVERIFVNLANDIIQELNRILAKEAAVFAFQQLLGLKGGSNQRGFNLFGSLLTVGTSLLGGLLGGGSGYTPSGLQIGGGGSGNGGGNNSGMSGSFQTLSPITNNYNNVKMSDIEKIVSELNHRPQIINVIVDPREVSKAAEIGKTLRYG